MDFLYIGKKNQPFALPHSSNSSLSTDLFFFSFYFFLYEKEHFFNCFLVQVIFNLNFSFELLAMWEISGRAGECSSESIYNATIRYPIWQLVKERSRPSLPTTQESSQQMHGFHAIRIQTIIHSFIHYSYRFLCVLCVIPSPAPEREDGFASSMNIGKNIILRSYERN